MVEQENRYSERDPRNQIKDGEARALYWHSYRKAFERLKDVLVVGEEIPDGTEVCLIGNNRLDPDNFHLRKKDRLPIGEAKLPGVSAHILFTRNIHEACGGIFDRDCRRQDRLYVTDTNTLRNIGYHPVYAPTPNQPLHIRLVHDTFIEEPDRHQPPIKARRALVGVLNSEQIRRVDGSKIASSNEPLGT